MRIGIAITRAAAVEPTWTTAHLAWGLLRAGHAVRFVEPWDWEVAPDGRVLARAHAFDLPMPREAICHALVHRTASRRMVEFSSLDMLLLRMNPLNVTVLGFAAMVAARGVPVLNDPLQLTGISQKGWLVSLPDVPHPRSLVTRSWGAAHAFHEQEGDVVVKPARGSGGRGVSFVAAGGSAALDAAITMVRAQGDGFFVVQAYLPDADRGEKRILWLDGVVVGSYLRRRAPGEFRHNLAQGGIPEPCALTPADLRLAATVTPHLRRAGVWLAGIDVIGQHVVEVNVLNPGGVDRIRAFGNELVLDRILASLELRVQRDLTLANTLVGA